jgi:hypothetical protein
VAVEDTYVKRLQRRLEKGAGNSAPRVEVFNMGLPMYFPALERLVLETHGLQVEPDIVIVAIFADDLRNLRHADDVSVLDGALVRARRLRHGRRNGWRLWLHRHSYAARAIDTLLRRIRTNAEPAAAPGTIEAAWQATAADLASMARACHRHGASLLLLYIPADDEWETGHAERLPARMTRFAAAHDLPFVDTTAAFRIAAASRNDLYIPNDQHCSPAGHAVIADALAPRIAALVAKRARESTPERRHKL